MTCRSSAPRSAPRRTSATATRRSWSRKWARSAPRFDGFAHQTHDNSHYNCFKTEDIATRNGFTKLGIQNVGMLMTRGVLIDVAGFKGVDMLPDTYKITVADLEGAIKKQNLTFQPGDAIIIHTGWGKLWESACGA
jgi:hypothetical protein